MATYELQYILKEYKAELKAKQATETKIKTIANLIPGTNNILKIKGIGIITAAGFIAEVGDNPLQPSKANNKTSGIKSTRKQLGRT